VTRATTGAAALVRTHAELARARDAQRGRVGVVMTMGALHAGHAALLRRAREAADRVLVTIFVNPLQFGPREDLGRYPRTLDADLEVCRAEGVDLVFAPSEAEIYPEGRPQIRVEPGPLAATLEGGSRPGHFAGVLTVVLKLLNLTRPQLAFFGEKDYQQLTLIRAMVRDLDVPVEIISVATVREPDGLALSSRNRYLSGSDRQTAAALSRGLREGVAAAGSGADADGVVAAATKIVSGAPGVALDYLVLTDPMLGPPPASGPARLLVAATVGTTRLIDNMAVELYRRA
jgi:pantoate--beta-alanine ligase